jgi:arginase family enzyme
MASDHCLHVDLDGAWPREALPEARYLDCRDWGPRLRYSATAGGMRRFAEHMAQWPARFTLSGSGDFHHLTAVWLQRFAEPFTLVSFDNHPDWDVRPPRWGCGGWVSRALEAVNLEQAFIWGCGNFELEWPTRLFANRRALKAGRLHARPWFERLTPKAHPHWQTMTRESWREDFDEFAPSLRGKRVYVTVDLDCLRAEESVTNWENGLFTAEDIAWALRKIVRHAGIAAGDVCGAWSEPKYSRLIQRIEGRLDHPKLPPIDPANAREVNLRALQNIWPALTAA